MSYKNKYKRLLNGLVHDVEIFLIVRKSTGERCVAVGREQFNKYLFYIQEQFPYCKDEELEISRVVPVNVNECAFVMQAGVDINITKKMKYEDLI